MRRMVMKNGPITEKFLQRYAEGDTSLDKMFGFRYENSRFMIGNKAAYFQDDNIVINDDNNVI